MSVIEEVIAKAGSKSELARVLGTTKQFVSQLAKGDRPIPAKRCAAIEAAYGIPKERLRPDIFGPAA